MESEEVAAEEDPAPPLSPARVAAPAPASRAGDKGGFEDFRTELAASIQERVLGSLERSLGKHATRSASTAAEDADVEGLAERTSGLEERIRARVEAALRAKGIPEDEG